MSCTVKKLPRITLDSWSDHSLLVSRWLALLDLSARLYASSGDSKKEAPRACSDREGLRGAARTSGVSSRSGLPT